MQFPDVEHERDPLQLRDGQLAQPLLVEQRQRADANAMFVQLGHLVHHAVVGLSLTIEHHDVGAAQLNRFDQLVECSSPMSVPRPR